MKEQVMDLWKISFGDSDDFTQLYFERVYREENVLVIRENGRVISALQIRPCEMSYCGTILPAAYVCNVCTLPSERGRGWMSQLMRQAIEVMHERGYAITTLIPATEELFGLYERFGYAKAFDRSVEMHFSEELPPDPSSCRIVSSRQLPPETVYAYYNRKQREHPCTILHSADDWDILLQDCRMTGGDAWLALWQDCPVGIALAVPDVPDDSNMIYVKEIVCEDTDIRFMLVQHIMKQAGCNMAFVYCSPVRSTARPYGMARVLDRERMTDLYLSYHRPEDTSPLQETDIGRLTQTLLRYDRKEARMNLMLD
ncbi:MAG: GNAT family N-acetyltransferase [Tannerella sp.]|jgi:predicted acetyltransferase|nr:GNAT family N-acetyltransferase [Tannerella sp.]